MRALGMSLLKTVGLHHRVSSSNELAQSCVLIGFEKLDKKRVQAGDFICISRRKRRTFLRSPNRAASANLAEAEERSLPRPRPCEETTLSGATTVATQMSLDHSAVKNRI
jgi:hypothetical protein